MVVHGGFDEKSRILDSRFVLNLNTYQWLECLPKGEGPGKISHHSSCTVIDKKAKSVDLFREPMFER